MRIAPPYKPIAPVGKPIVFHSIRNSFHRIRNQFHRIRNFSGVAAVRNSAERFLAGLAGVNSEIEWLATH